MCVCARAYFCLYVQMQIQAHIYVHIHVGASLWPVPLWSFLILSPWNGCKEPNLNCGTQCKLSIGHQFNTAFMLKPKFSSVYEEPFNFSMPAIWNQRRLFELDLFWCSMHGALSSHVENHRLFPDLDMEFCAKQIQDTHARESLHWSTCLMIRYSNWWLSRIGFLLQCIIWYLVPKLTFSSFLVQVSKLYEVVPPILLELGKVKW